MTKHELNPLSEGEIEFLERLYTNSFPHHERRPFGQMLDMYRNNESFYIDIISVNGNPAGFMSYHDFDNFVFAEHFAFDPAMRNSGYGQKAILLLTNGSHKPIILEVEPPDTPIAERRIGFYRRAGFKYWEHIEYFQPSYHNDNAVIPMKLMTCGKIDLNTDMTAVRECIYKGAYGLWRI